MNPHLFDLLSNTARQNGVPMIQLERKIREVLDSPKWRRAAMLERLHEVSAEIDKWPKWEQDFCRQHLNQPFVSEEERGEDINPRW